MDLNNIKKVMGVGLLTAAAITNSPAQAATGNVVVDVTFPTVLVMYYYSDIDLDFDQETLGSYLVGSGSNCGGDWCNDQGNTTFTVNSITGGTASVTPTAVGGPGLAATTLNIELVDVVGARAIGCGPTGDYDANFTVTGTAGIVAQATPQAVGTLDGAQCSLALTTGTVDFDVDFDQLPAGSDTAQATVAVTVNGI